MTISQHRMIALINSTLDFRRAAQTLCTAIIEACEAARAQPHHAPTILLQLEAQANLDTLLNSPSDSTAALTFEYNHFRRNFKRNERATQKAASKRRLNGAITRATTARANLPLPGSNLPGSIKYIGMQPPTPSTPINETELELGLEQAAKIAANCPHEWITSPGTDQEFCLHEFCLHCGTHRNTSSEQCPHCGATSDDCDIKCKNTLNCPWIQQIN